MTEDLLAYLTSKGVKARRTSGNEVVAHCFFCEETKRAPKLYINAESWLYDCKLCGAAGNRKTLLRHFGDKDEEPAYLPGQSPLRRREILLAAANKAHELLLDNEAQLAYLLDRGLSERTIFQAKLGYVPPNLGFARSLGDYTVADLIGAGLMTSNGMDFLNNSLTIPYWHHGAVVQLRAKDLDGRYRTAGGDNVRLFNQDALHGRERALITEGELDALILQQHLEESADPIARSIGVVALPGAKSLPDHFGSYFTECKRVYIGMDPDLPGRQGAAKVREQLGTVARMVELPPGDDELKNDWTEYLRPANDRARWGGHGWRDVMVLLAHADAAGKRVFSIQDTMLRWEREQHERPGLKLGWPTMDATLTPGLKPGQLMIPLAKTGTGKTVFLANIAHNTRASRVLFVSLEQTATELFGMLRRIHYFHFPDKQFSEIANDYNQLRIVDENRLREQDVETLVAEYLDDVGAPPELLIIDYLGYFARGFKGGSPYEKTSSAVMELKALAKAHDLPIIAPHQVNRAAKDGMPIEADDARDSGVVEETADFVLSLYRPDQAPESKVMGMPSTSGAFNAALLKSRHGGKGKTFQLRFSNMSLAIVDATDQRARARIEQENDLYARGTQYEQWRRETSTVQLKVVS